jgi:hypothetical protein
MGITKILRGERGKKNSEIKRLKKKKTHFDSDFSSLLHYYCTWSFFGFVWSV